MAGFDDNFAESLENPFEDPSITRVTSNAPAMANPMDNYEPFGPESLGNMSGPAVMRAGQTIQQPPQYARSAIQTEGISELERRQRELDLKAQELDRRERMLKETPTNVRRNNWPPLPEGFCVQPCFYIDINTEIKVEFQQIVRRLYYLWIVHTSLLILNMFGAFCMLVNDATFEPFVVSIVYLVLFTPLSFLCWYRPVYKAFREDSSFQFMVFFFVFFFQFLTSVFMAVGVLGSGACGLVEAITLLKKSGAGNVVVGVIILIIALGFASVAAIELFLLATMLKIYRGSEASIDKARNEFATGFLGSQIVRDATTEAAAATIRSQLNQQSNRR